MSQRSTYMPAAFGATTRAHSWTVSPGPTSRGLGANAFHHDDFAFAVNPVVRQVEKLRSLPGQRSGIPQGERDGMALCACERGGRVIREKRNTVLIGGSRNRAQKTADNGGCETETAGQAGELPVPPLQFDIVRQRPPRGISQSSRVCNDMGRAFGAVHDRRDARSKQSAESAGFARAR